MLKISIKDRKAGRLLVLEGKLIAPWTNELTKAACQNSENHLSGRGLLVDLQGVTDISTEGEEALYCLMARGGKLRGGGVFIRQVVRQVAQRARRNNSV
jgi:anti-anti-sigma regulatory factor